MNACTECVCGLGARVKLFASYGPAHAFIYLGPVNFLARRALLQLIVINFISKPPRSTPARLLAALRSYDG